MKTRHTRCNLGRHPAIAAVIVGTFASLLFLSQPVCAQDKPGYDEGGQFFKYADSSTTESGTTTESATNESKENLDDKTKDESEAKKQYWQYADVNQNPAARRRSLQDQAQFADEQTALRETGDPLDVIPDEVELSMRQDELRGPGRWFFNTRIGQQFARFEAGDIRKRPMMYWRRFADRHLPPVGTFLFFFFFNTTFCLAFRKRVEVASRCVSKSFWKSLLVGMLFVILMATGARLCFDSALYTPCALLILGVVQLLSLAGLAVSSRTVGLAVLNKLGFSKGATEVATDSADATLTEKLESKFEYLAPVFVGTILFTLIALLPGLGPLPRLGTRFIMWLSLLGLGALVRTKLGRKELS